METVHEKVAYLQGLSKGLNINERSPEGKLLLHMLDTFECFADELEQLHFTQNDLEEYVETMDEDLTDLEDTVYEDYSDEDTETVEVECPECHETVAFDSDVLNYDENIEVSCPQCGEVVYHHYEEDPGI